MRTSLVWQFLLVGLVGSVTGFVSMQSFIVPWLEQRQPIVDLSKNGVSAQSSLYDDTSQSLPEGGIDGIISGTYGFCTRNEQNPWWQVRLQGAAKIREILIYNRVDCCQKRAAKLLVQLSSDNVKWVTVYRHSGKEPFGGKDGKFLRIILKDEVARYVRVQLGELGTLHLDEIQVLGRLI